MKKRVLIFLGASIMLLLGGLYLVLRPNPTEFVNVRDDQIVSFNILYDIDVQDKTLIPAPVFVHENLDEENAFLEKHKLNAVLNYFDLEAKPNFSLTKIIWLYPKNFVALNKISRYKVTKTFFTKRGVSENNAKKTVAIFSQTSDSYSECLKKLERIYKGSEFNQDFLKRGIPNLIN